MAIVLRMAVATASEEVVEARRRSLLAESDLLLEDVEDLRLRDEDEVPPRLREAIGALQASLGRKNPAPSPATIDAAHDLVFAVQQRLMAANPRIPRPNRHIRRPGGQPVVTVIREDMKWKVLTLPPPSSSADETDWIELVDSTVERAWDRWCYAQQHAVRAARERLRAQVAVAVASAAWTNYWELLQESDRIQERLSARPGRLAGGTFLARPR